MSAVIYTRVSTQEQAKHGLSLGIQEKQCRAYAEMRGLSVAGVCTDAGVSGGKPLGDRPAGERLLLWTGENGQDEDFTDVIALKLDRLFRNAADALTTTQEWTKRGVSLHLVDMGGMAIDTSKPMGRMMLTMLAGFAEFEHATIRERTKSGLDAKRASGGYCGGSPPYGKKLFQGELVDSPHEILAMDMLRRLSIENMSLSKMADFMTHQTTYQPRRGKRWKIKTIKKILKRVV